MKSVRVVSHRDLRIIEINGLVLVIANDSAGGIGPKPMDVVKTEGEVVGYYTAVVALMEVVSFGATPFSVIDNLCVEMKEVGESILRGIQRAVEPLDLSGDALITGSTEENIPTVQTGIGVTVVGVMPSSDWPIYRTEPGDTIIALGQPKVGDEVVRDNEQTTMNLNRLCRLRELPFVKEIIPVGSGGIRHELEAMETTNKVSIDLNESIALDLDKTAGPATVVIVSVREENIEALRNQIDLPLVLLGKAKKRIEHCFRTLRYK